MVQEQLTGAMQKALGAGLGGDLGALPSDGRRAAGGVLRAMLVAQKSGCTCEACELLRPEMTKVLTVALEGLTEALTEPAEAAATSPAPTSAETVESAPGPDTPA